MASINIPIPTLQGKKTYLVGLAMVLMGLSEISNDLGTGLLTPDLALIVGHAGATKILEGLGFIFVRMGVKSEAKSLPTQLKEAANQ